ncbi:transcription initiation factor TFIID subunit 7-like [Beta vulgaris subsp. vulgaris]|uniref:transcription initiation factor TFIID subunit 7-like n=1 Tax=Beta vulgaris subsp. vulgaris TaxID=3555 RepID=UPI0025496098|nr:transcription initiation factor TFIID subunit 7-like [Beta vulgaris subsp. vulgaris]
MSWKNKANTKKTSISTSCFKCGEAGHMIKDCPAWKNDKGGQKEKRMTKRGMLAAWGDSDSSGESEEDEALVCVTALIGDIEQRQTSSGRKGDIYYRSEGMTYASGVLKMKDEAKGDAAGVGTIERAESDDASMMNTVTELCSALQESYKRIEVRLDRAGIQSRKDSEEKEDSSAATGDGDDELVSEEKEEEEAEEDEEAASEDLEEDEEGDETEHDFGAD